MNLQGQFDFTSVLHSQENNKHSQEILEDNYERLTKACETVHKVLLTGVRLSAANFTAKTGLCEYRRRFADLIKAGFPVQSETKENAGGCKEWFYTAEYIHSLK